MNAKLRNLDFILQVAEGLHSRGHQPPCSGTPFVTSPESLTPPGDGEAGLLDRLNRKSPWGSDAWVAQSDKPPTLDLSSGLDLRALEFKPLIGLQAGHEA